MENRKIQFDGPYIFASIEQITGIITEGEPPFEIATLLQPKDIFLL